MRPERTPPPPRSEDAHDLDGEQVEVRLVSASPEAARRVADALRLMFTGDEQRSYPAGPSGTGTRLHLTVDAARAAGPLSSWLDSSSTSADRAHPDETG
ncbi:hypothetical protein [Streptomyces sp. NPDC088785]|uniref:hypothetical protein n=1 Tax=Streptomyces sp. NPDC088785 TaxID=3365897 RepID=UPI00382A6381